MCNNSMAAKWWKSSARKKENIKYLVFQLKSSSQSFRLQSHDDGLNNLTRLVPLKSKLKVSLSVFRVRIKQTKFDYHYTFSFQLHVVYTAHSRAGRRNLGTYAPSPKRGTTFYKCKKYPTNTTVHYSTYSQNNYTY